MIDRETFCKLTDIRTIEAFKVRSRRNQIPLLDKEQRRGRGFYLAEVYLQIIADSLHEGGRGLSLYKSADIARLCAPNLRKRWADILTASNPKCGQCLK